MTTSPFSRGLALALCFALGAAPLSAAADGIAATNPDAVAQARQHFTHAVKLYEEDDFRTALIEFNRAYELAPNWQVLFNIGQAYYQLRDYANALRTLERYVAAGGGAIAAERKQQVEREIEELRGRVAHVTLSTNVEGAEVFVDDASIGRTPFAGAQLIGAGRHRLSANKVGWLPTAKTIDIAGGDNLTIRLDLSEEPHEKPREPIAQTVKYQPSYAATYVVGGVGLAGIVVGTIFGVAAFNNRTSLGAECNGSRQCPYGTQGEIDAFSRNGLISTVGFSVGAGALVVAAVLYFTERGKAGTDTPAVAMRRRPGRTLWPVIGPRGLGLSGTF